MTNPHHAVGFLTIARVALVPLICVITLIAGEQRIGAIVGGAPTGADRARNVGTLVVSRDGEPWVWGGCGVTLISARVGVTAGHCIAFAYRGSTFTRIGVSFADRHVFGAPLPTDLDVHEGIDVLHPAFKPLFGGGLPLQDLNDPALADVGAIVFNRPIRDLLPAHLPKQATLEKATTLDSLFDFPFDVGLVGYGTTSFDAVIGRAPFDGGTRRFTTMTVDTVYPAVITLAPSPGDTCFFDSGGPAFSSVNGHVPPVIVAVHGIIAGPANGAKPCAGGTSIMRLDVPHVDTWLRHLIAMS